MFPWTMMGEYRNFTPLFYLIINELQKTVSFFWKKVKLFCKVVRLMSKKKHKTTNDYD